MNTGPENAWNCWMQAISIFQEPISVQSEGALNLELKQTSSRIQFKVPARA